MFITALYSRKALEVVQVSSAGRVERIFWVHDIAYYVAIGNSKSDVHIQNEGIMLQTCKCNDEIYNTMRVNMH